MHSSFQEILSIPKSRIQYLQLSDCPFPQYGEWWDCRVSVLSDMVNGSGCKILNTTAVLFWRQFLHKGYAGVLLFLSNLSTPWPGGGVENAFKLSALVNSLVFSRATPFRGCYPLTHSPAQLQISGSHLGTARCDTVTSLTEVQADSSLHCGVNF